MSTKKGFYVWTRFIGRKRIYNLIVDYINCLERMITIPGFDYTDSDNDGLSLLLREAKQIMRDYLHYWLIGYYKAENYRR